MMPLVFPKFPPCEPETRALKEIREFREKAALVAKLKRRATLRAAFLWPWRRIAGFKQKAARFAPRRLKNPKGSSA